jgi:hypothetical protein
VARGVKTVESPEINDFRTNEGHRSLLRRSRRVLDFDDFEVRRRSGP